MFTLASDDPSTEQGSQCTLAGQLRWPIGLIVLPGPGSGPRAARGQCSEPFGTNSPACMRRCTSAPAGLGLSAPNSGSGGSPGRRRVGPAHSTSALYAHAGVWHSCLIQGVSLSLCRQAAWPAGPPAAAAAVRSAALLYVIVCYCSFIVFYCMLL